MRRGLVSILAALCLVPVNVPSADLIKPVQCSKPLEFTAPNGINYHMILSNGKEGLCRELTISDQNNTLRIYDYGANGITDGDWLSFSHKMPTGENLDAKIYYKHNAGNISSTLQFTNGAKINWTCDLTPPKISWTPKGLWIKVKYGLEDYFYLQSKRELIVNFGNTTYSNIVNSLYAYNVPSIPDNTFGKAQTMFDNNFPQFIGPNHDKAKEDSIKFGKGLLKEIEKKKKLE